MSLSTDVIPSRRAVSAQRIRSNQQSICFLEYLVIKHLSIKLDMTNRRASNDSPITRISHDNIDNSTSKFI
jgi:hypothetical protein